MAVNEVSVAKIANEIGCIVIVFSYIDCSLQWYLFMAPVLHFFLDNCFETWVQRFEEHFHLIMSLLDYFGNNE